MSEVEEAYLQAIDRMTPAEKFARLHAQLNWMRDLYARQIRDRLGEISEERMKLEVALRMYGHEPQMRELLERELRKFCADSNPSPADDSGRLQTAVQSMDPVQNCLAASAES